MRADVRSHSRRLLRFKEVSLNLRARACFDCQARMLKCLRLAKALLISCWDYNIIKTQFEIPFTGDWYYKSCLWVIYTHFKFQESD